MHKILNLEHENLNSIDNQIYMRIMKEDSLVEELCVLSDV